MQFLHPIWLTAMAGIIIPIAIHLWNVRQGKILEVGTIRFMEPSQKKRASNLRISEWLLLLLRCLTILLFALVMAGPVWQKTAGRDEKGWLLIPTKDLKEAYHQKSVIIDSLLKNGYQLHAFEEGFSAISLSDSTTKNTDSSIVANTPNYWALASKLVATAPLGIDLTIISSNQIQYFKGNKPSLNRLLQWKVFIDTIATQTIISNAWQASEDSIGILLAKASSKSIVHETKMIAKKSNQAKEFVLKTVKGTQAISYQNQEPIIVDTATFRIALFTDLYLHDASYVAAAVQAIREFTKRKIRFEIFKSANAIPSATDLLFWLSDAPPPVSAALKIISYQKGMIHQETGFVYGIEGASENLIELYQYIECNQNNLTKIWENGKGDPILAVDPIAPKYFLLFTHFDPSWNNLVWSNRFAEWMLPFVFEGLSMQAVKDSRAIDPGELDFSKVDKSSNIKMASPANSQPIGNIFWFLLMLVFIIERILSFTSKNKANV